MCSLHAPPCPMCCRTCRLLCTATRTRWARLRSAPRTLWRRRAPRCCPSLAPTQRSTRYGGRRYASRGGGTYCWGARMVRVAVLLWCRDPKPCTAGRVAVHAMRHAFHSCKTPHATAVAADAAVAATDVQLVTTRRWSHSPTAGAAAAAAQLVFTRSATGALDLIGQWFPWSSGSSFAYTRTNHNSVLGMTLGRHLGTARF